MAGKPASMVERRVSQMPDWTSDILTPQPDPVGADFLAVPRTDVGPGGSTWQTLNGAELGSDGFDIFAVPHDPEGEARLVAECEDRKAKDQEARRQAEAERAAERAAAKTLADAQAESERLAMEARMAKIIEDEKARRVDADALRAALEHQDTDFHCIQVLLPFRGETGDGTGIEEEYDFTTTWGFDEDETTDLALVAGLKAEINKAIEPLTSHYDSLGLVRADLVNFAPSGEPTAGQDAPRYFLVIRAEDMDLSPAELGSFEQVDFKLAGGLGGKLTLAPYTRSVNATMLHSAATRGGVGVGQWGGAATPELAPSPGEDRDAWLARVAMPREQLARLVERWVASGRNVHVFRSYGDYTERNSGSKPTEWLVEGVLARGVLTLLAGDGSAGKTSLVYEWLSCLSGSPLARARAILGQEVSGRFFCAAIWGEGVAGMNTHRSERHATIWGRSAFYERKATREELPDILAELRKMPVVDLLVLDPMRPFLKGDEKSSDVINEFYRPLEQFAEDMNCAVVITQHVSKSGMNGKSANDAKSAILGATTVINRPRMVIAIDRRGETVRIAPVKHNFAEEMLWVRSTEWSIWRHDQATHTLISNNSRSGSNVPMGEAVSGLLLAAVAEQNRLGRTVRQTGVRELFERKLPELLGMTRRSIRAGTAAMLDAGQLIDGPEGLVAVPDDGPNDGGEK